MMRGFVLLGIVSTLVACDHLDEITPKKYVSLIVAHTARLKIEMAKSLVTGSGKSIPQAGELKLTPPAGVEPMKFDFGWVTSTGVIIIQSQKYSVVVIQEPTISLSVVTWSCVVHPVEAKPNLCGSEYENSLLQGK